MNLSAIFTEHKKNFNKNAYPSIKERKEVLNALKKLLQNHASELVHAVNKDFSHRAKEETLLLEILPTINAIDYCLKQLKKWIKPQKRQVPWYLQPSKASVIAQPLGVVGIIVPWNYPIYLSLGPTVYALAAGNHVMIKLSELTPQLGKTLSTLINKEHKLNKIISIVNGEVEVAKEFTNLPFGHLLFTGSTTVGKHVMASASKNLTPVTLELGGKSPAIISTSVNYDYLDRLFMGKLFNAGQTCIAPDYLLIPKKLEQRIEELFSKFIELRYAKLMENDHYSSLISEHHKERLELILTDAEKKGARIVQFGEKKENIRKLPLYLLFNVNQKMQVMNEEIFGPLLPILTYDSFNQAIDVIHSMPNPLSLYYFGENETEISLLKYKTLSGALTINDTLMHIAIDDLPFGGVGYSGTGHYHGPEGFATFSKIKPIFIQRRISPISLFYPPYGKLLHYFIRYFAGIKLKEKK